MIIGKPAPFVNAFIDAVAETIRELQPDGALEGQICFHSGDEADFTARPWATSSTAC